MKSYTMLLAAALLVAIFGAVTMAMWSETLKINVAVSTGELDWGFMNGSLTLKDACGLQPGYGPSGGNDWNATVFPAKGGEQLDKDVGCTEVKFLDTDGDGDYDTLNVTLHNAYPWYYTHIGFSVCNTGTIPLKIWRVVIDGQDYYEINAEGVENGVDLDLDNDNMSDVRFWWGDNFGEQLHPGGCADISFDITVLQPAKESTTYSFLVKFEAIAWNEYEAALPPTTTTTTPP